MAKSPFIPPTDAEKRLWLNNFSSKLGTYAATVGVTAAEVTATAADNLLFGYVVDAHHQHAQTTQNWTAYKNGARGGPTLGAMPTTPALGAPPPLVPPNIFGRAAALAGRIKKHPGYTEAIGQDLGLIGADITIDLATLKPILVVALKAAHPNVGWTKQGMDGLEILVDRGAGAFSFLAFDTIPDYLDTAPLPAPGASAVWKYKAIYRLGDDPAVRDGQWSDVVSIPVAG